MSNPLKAGILFCAVFLLCSGRACAEQAGIPQVKAEFQKIDANKDGYVTSEEMQAYQAKKFSELDKDKNGVVDAKEVKADNTQVMQKADGNKDGKITAQESSAQFREYFQELDANKDNKVSEDEYTDYWKWRMKF